VAGLNGVVSVPGSVIVPCHPWAGDRNRAIPKAGARRDHGRYARRL